MNTQERNKTVRCKVLLLAALLYGWLALPAFAQTTYTITPNPATVNENAGSVIFTITRSGSTPSETIYASTTQTEGYLNSSDYVGFANQAVSFTAGQTSRAVTVTVLNDSTTENNETFGFIVQRNTSDPVITYLAKSKFTIIDDDQSTTYSITPNPATVNENAGSVTFTITRSGGTPTETIYASTTQTEGYSNSGDYTGIGNQAVTFSAGQTTSFVTVTILNDSTFENNETFGFIVQRNTSDPVSTYLAKSKFTIIDDDQSTTYSISPNAATVGENAGSVTFTITRSGGTPAETIYVSTTQTEGYSNSGDYTGIGNQAVSFGSGQISRTVPVTILDDSTMENNETFGFIVQRNTSDPVTTYLAKSTFTIVDDDSVPVSDGFDYPIGSRVRYTEANDGDGWYVATEFNELYNSKYHLGEDWNAESGGNTDYGSPVYAVANGTIIFAGPATVSGWGNVLIVRHKLPDGTLVESLYGHVATFQRTSGNVVRGEQIATVGDGGGLYSAHLHLEIRFANCPKWGSEGLGYSLTPNPQGWTDPSDFIDAHRPGGATAYSITPNPATVNENAGSVTFTITRSGGMPAETIYASTTQTEGFANSGDYIGIANQGLTFASGQTTSTAKVTVLNDSVAETNETFGFIVQRNTTDPVATYLAKSTFTIVDDDVQPTTYTISSNSASVSENAGSVTFTITRSGGTPAETIYASTTQTEGSANIGDYVGVVNQPITFASGQNTNSVKVTILDDSTVEPNETFGFIVQRNTTDPVATYLAKSTFTIVDDDAGLGDYPNASWMPAAPANITVTNRTSSDVRWIIIHTTEGTTASAIQRFQNPAEQASAHYIISRDGSIIQLVHNKDISFGAGNYSYNEKCINIEHERYDTSNVTPAEYAASAALVKWLASRYNVQVVFPGAPNGIAPTDPANGTGIIGHRQVPDPSNPTIGGGLNHHTDPVNWDWNYYESLFLTNKPPLFTGIGGGALLPPINGQFQFEVHSDKAQMTIQASDDLVNWIDIETVTLVNGTAPFADPNAGAHIRRYYRPKP
jgi:murein DD-endopeptidase MepM/ murein hydrolase activator NlpD